MSSFDSLDKTFGTDASLDAGAKTMKSITKRVRKEYASDAEEDYDYVRGMLKSSAEALSEITSNAMGVAEQSDHPRAYEVAANAAKQTSEVVEKIMSLHKDKKELENEVQQASVNDITTQNNIFMTGSTSDLLAALKGSNALSGVDTDSL
jgi:hypothetical protein